MENELDGKVLTKTNAKISAISDMGRVRTNNEDNLNINGYSLGSGQVDLGYRNNLELSEPFVICVCDGMGGEEFGELASAIGVNTLSEYKQAIFDSGENYAAVINDYFQKANERICAEIQNTGKRLGTTVALLCGFNGKLIAANVGDSRIYRLSGGSLTQISTDHTEIESQIKAGLISPEQAQLSNKKHKLTQHLGILPSEMIIEPAIKVIGNVEDGDVFLLCSDGLTDMVADDHIKSIISRSGNAENAAKTLVNSALENGGKDNVTVIVAALKVENSFAAFPPSNIVAGAKTGAAANKKPVIGKKAVAVAAACFTFLLLGVLIGIMINRAGNKPVDTTQAATEFEESSTAITEATTPATEKTDIYNIITYETTLHQVDNATTTIKETTIKTQTIRPLWFFEN